MTAPDLHLDDETLFALLDVALRTAESVSAKSHLSGCPECRARAVAFQALFSDLAALPDLPAPRDFTPAVLAVVKRKAAGRAPQRLPGPVWVGVALQLAAALGILLLVGREIAGNVWAGPILPDPIGWLEGLTRPVEALPSLASEWAATAAAWLDGLDFPALAPDRLDGSELMSGLAAILPLIASSALLWLVGNALLIRRPRRNTGER